MYVYTFHCIQDGIYTGGSIFTGKSIGCPETLQSSRWKRHLGILLQIIEHMVLVMITFHWMYTSRLTWNKDPSQTTSLYITSIAFRDPVWDARSFLPTLRREECTTVTWRKQQSSRSCLFWPTNGAEFYHFISRCLTHMTREVLCVAMGTQPLGQSPCRSDDTPSGTSLYSPKTN